MEAYAAEGHFASGSMGPKVEAALRFVRSGGRRSIITALDRITEAIDSADGRVGTVIENDAARALPTAADQHQKKPTGRMNDRARAH